MERTHDSTANISDHMSLFDLSSGYILGFGHLDADDVVCVYSEEANFTLGKFVPDVGSIPQGNEKQFSKVASRECEEPIKVHLTELGLFPQCISFWAKYGEARSSMNRGALIKIQGHNASKLPLFRLGVGVVAFKVLIQTLQDNGMHPTMKDTYDLLWCKRPLFEDWASSSVFQKVNHFPMTWAVGKKCGQC